MYTFRVQNVPIGGFVGVSEDRATYTCRSTQYDASCRDGSPCVECDGWTGLRGDWGMSSCPLGHNVRRPSDPASATCRATIPGERLSSSGQPTFAAYAYSGRYTDADINGLHTDIVRTGDMVVSCPGTIGQSVPVRTFLPSPTATVRPATPTPNPLTPTPTRAVHILSAECELYNRPFSCPVPFEDDRQTFHTFHRLRIVFHVSGPVGFRVPFAARLSESILGINDPDPNCAGNGNCQTCVAWTGRDPVRPLDVLRAAGDPEETECVKYIFLSALSRYPRPLFFIVGDALGTAQCAGSSAAVEVLSVTCNGDRTAQITARVAGPPGSSFSTLFRQPHNGSATEFDYFNFSCSSDLRTERCTPEEGDCVACEGWHGSFSGPCPCPGGDARAEGDPEETVCTYTTHLPSDYQTVPYDIVAVHITAGPTAGTFGNSSLPSYVDIVPLTCAPPVR
jgi:hypothetical protein